MLDYAKARRMMVDGQLRTFDVNSIPVLAAFEDVPREAFVPRGREDLAYSDRPLDLGGSEGRSMLAPMVLARLVQALEIGLGERVLEVATGLGYGAAILDRLGAEVIALESDAELAEAARGRLAGAGAGRVLVVSGPLDQGWPAAAPYDAILVNGALEVRPERLLAQLSPGHGRLACVMGRGRPGRATLHVRSGEAFGARTLFDAAAAPLPAFRDEPGFVF